MRSAGLHAADPGGGLAQAGSHMEPTGGHSSSGRGIIRAAGSWRKVAASDPCYSGPNGAAEAGSRAARSRLALSSPVQPFPHLETGSVHPGLCPFATCPWGTTGPFWLSSWPSISDSRAWQAWAGELGWQGATRLRKRQAGRGSRAAPLNRWGTPAGSPPATPPLSVWRAGRRGRGRRAGPASPLGPCPLLQRHGQPRRGCDSDTVRP